MIRPDDPADHERSPRLYTRRFLLLYVAHLTGALSFLAFVLLPLRIEELGGAELDIGWVAAAGGGAGVAIRWLTGHLSDRLGRRQVMLAAAALNVVACFGFVWINDLWPFFYVMRVLHGIASGALFGIFFTMAADLSPPERRAEGLAVFGTSGMLGGWLGPFLGERAIAHGGFTAFFVLVGVVGAVSVGLIALLPESRGRLAPVGLSPALLGQPGLLPAFLLTLCFGLAIGSMHSFLAPHFVRLGTLEVSDFFLFYSGAALTLRLAGRRLPDRLGVKRLLPPAYGSLLLGVALVGITQNPWLLRVAGLLCGLGHGYVFPLLNALVVRRTPEERRGLAVSLFTAFIDLGVLIGAPILGAVAARWGYPVMFQTTALGVGVVAAVLGVVALRGRAPAQRA